jgi:2-polyprenyl-6-methoxyphenol hydroxylase-like FAD-dependent oxidoreductase
VSDESRESRIPNPESPVVIAGCGPAGALAGYLLARAGVPVLVLEKHADFLRDFRGDTIHPSTLEILDELGLADRFLALPHSKVSSIMLQSTSGQTVTLSLSRVPSKFPYIAFVPQWDFLEFLTAEGQRFPTFTLKRNAEAIDLIQSSGVVSGLRYVDETGTHDVNAALVIGADGRESRTREAAGLPRIESSPPMDVFWFRVSRRRDEPEAVAGRIGAGKLCVMLNRGDYWQVAYLIPKGGADRIRAAGIEAFRRDVASIARELAGRVEEIRDWNDVKLLTVRADRLTRWHKPGYLAIGDAAHAMSPIGGVGINVAIHDAVEAANLLWRPLREGRVTDADLARVQHRRERAVRIIQAFQSAVQTGFLKPTLESTRPATIPLIIRIVARMPILRDMPPRLIALGVSRPHVESPDLPRPT